MTTTVTVSIKWRDPNMHHPARRFRTLEKARRYLQDISPIHLAGLRAACLDDGNGEHIFGATRSGWQYLFTIGSKDQPEESEAQAAGVAHPTRTRGG